ncbi:DUF624 domain-containing protein [Paenarthrobacter sp. NPDC090522]|uniref:DUF624 domain-containing protein n=1 Tax=Paenarthrobacter sp. NPDC090522 TaxID=3364383 RepID=UPI00381675E9
MAATKAEFGSGKLFKAAGTVYGVMVGSGLLVLTNVLVLAMPLLGPLAPIPLVLVGPAVVAACYAFNRLMAGEDTGVSRDFRTSYRLNFWQALAVWLPYLALLAVIAANLMSLPGSNPETVAARVGLLGLAVLVSTAAVHALLLLSRFAFRTVDIYRLSLYTLGSWKRVSLGNAGIVFIAGFLLTTTSVWLVPFISGAVVYLICLNSRPLLKRVEEKFTLPA